MENSGSCLRTAPASSIRATFPSTDFLRRCTSSRSPPTTRPTHATSDGMAPAPAPAGARSGDRLHRAQPRRAGKDAVSLQAGRLGSATGRTWAIAGRRSITIFLRATTAFASLACNNSGVWNEAGASFDFSIAPAFYQTDLVPRVVRWPLFWRCSGALYRLRLDADRAAIQHAHGRARQRADAHRARFARYPAAEFSRRVAEASTP